MFVAEYITNLQNALCSIYDRREASNIARYVMEELYGRNFIRQNNILSDLQLKELSLISKRLLMSEPVQYILEAAWFYNLQFKVTSSVLIPRPETEELVDNILKTINGKNVSVLDIGTGSGCIAIALKKNLPQSTIYASDISDAALEIAKKNAETHSAEIFFIQNDIIISPCSLPGQLDIVVSNPPYISVEEKKEMHKNVLLYEPHQALFTPTDDAGYFYTIIAEQALKLLKPHGLLFFEMNYSISEQIRTMLVDKGYSQVEIINDLQGKPRIIKAQNTVYGKK
ncbi:MAG: peptide chain release factor N(5)-glutamine methyltransferase [Chitinophagales bacterium]